MYLPLDLLESLVSLVFLLLLLPVMQIHFPGWNCLKEQDWCVAQCHSAALETVWLRAARISLLHSWEETQAAASCKICAFSHLTVNPLSLNTTQASKQEIARTLLPVFTLSWLLFHSLICHWSFDYRTSGPGKMASPLRVLATLSEDLSSVLSARGVRRFTTGNSSFRGPNPLFWTQRIPAIMHMYPYIYT